jgi:Cu/Ag efflux pump CusA
MPGIRSQVTTYEDTQTNDVLERPTNSVTVRIYGHDYPLLRQEAHRLRGILGGIGGVQSTRLEGLPVETPTLRVQVDLAKALRHEIKPGDVRRAVATMTSGLTVGNFFEEQAVFDVVVLGVPATRQNIDSVRNLLIDTPAGGTVRVGQVARVSIGPDPTDIQHDATSRFLDLRLNTTGSDAGSVRSEAKHRLGNVAFPLAYHAEVLSGSAEGQTSKGQFLAYVIAAEIAVFLLLQAAFASWSLAFAVFLSVPLATAGGVIVALASGRGGSLGELAGLLAILGLVLRPAITMVTRVERLQRVEEGATGMDLTLRVARERFVPTAMAAVATALAMLPFAVVGSTAGNEITQPLAQVLLGGTLTAAVVNLLIVPAICVAWGSAVPERSPEEQLADLDAEGNT